MVETIRAGYFFEQSAEILFQASAQWAFPHPDIELVAVRFFPVGLVTQLNTKSNMKTALNPTDKPGSHQTGWYHVLYVNSASR